MLRLDAPSGKVRASLLLPGSKSISNRLLVLRYVFGIEAEISNLSNAADTRILVQALQMIRGSGAGTLDVQQAGTDMRFLTALLAASPGEWTLTGSERMRERPIGELVDALRQLGADIEYRGKQGYPPLKIKGRELKSVTVNMKADISSQFISALLLIAPKLGGISLQLQGRPVSRPYVDMTLSMLKQFGMETVTDEQHIEVKPKRRKKLPAAFTVESDWSSASYYYSLCLLAPDLKIELKSFSKTSLQADAQVSELFKRLGIHTVFRKGSVLIQKAGETPASFEQNFRDCPDIAQTIAAACFGAGIPCKLSGLETLRIKETDRIAALQTEFEKLGARVQTTDDSIDILPPKITAIRGPVIETYGDHRMALAFAPLAFKYPHLFIQDHQVVDKSYPGFWNDLRSLGFSLTLQP